MLRCPYCGKQNQPDSTFCIHCGEPTDEDSVRDFALAHLQVDGPGPTKSRRTEDPQAASRPPRFRWRDLVSPQHGLEFLLGVTILLIAAGFGIYYSARQEITARHYHAGAQAANSRDYERARAELSAAGDYMDAPGLLQEVQEKLAMRDRLYEEALEVADAEKWWQAAYKLKEVAGVTEGYRDAAALLTQARRVNGIILYRLRARADGRGAIYLAQADGGEVRRLPATDWGSHVHAVSTDSKWLVYSHYRPPTDRTLFLYEAATGSAWGMYLPATAQGIVTARFAEDGRKVWIDRGGSTFTYDLPASGQGGTTLQPISLDSEEAGELQDYVALVLNPGPEEGTTVMVVTGYKGSDPRAVATEDGEVDGAIFSADRRYLAYRVCTPSAEVVNAVCRLKLVDLSLPTLHAATIGSMAVPDPASRQWTLNGEFTRDGGHLLLIRGNEGGGSAQIYDLQTGETIKVEEIPSGDVESELINGLLVGSGVPGLEHWQGPNSLTYTRLTVPVTERHADWAQRYYARSHWVAISPGDRYVLYVTGKEGNTRISRSELFVRPLAPDTPPVSDMSHACETSRSGAEAEVEVEARQAQPMLLLRTRARPLDWLRMTYLLPDGQTVLSVEAPAPGTPRGLYAYDLGSGQNTLAIPDVTELWWPGFASLMPDIPRFWDR